ncbi:MAG: Holliday junction resolvase RecU [Clostridiales bacterium]|jgi:recombination protein U|nr:Holliday junction resolvase RecU [Clostridiales bacterium]
MAQARGLRGDAFESLINMTNDWYRLKGLALIQKVPTPITPIEFDQTSRTISLAYFERKSTVDYIGVAQGIPLCFDAKETRRKSFPLANVHDHQMEFMSDFESHGGVAFILVNFTAFKKIFFTPLEHLRRFKAEAERGGRKSAPYEAFNQSLSVESRGYMIHYLEALNAFISSKE